jgi:hypothetical protein
MILSMIDVVSRGERSDGNDRSIFSSTPLSCVSAFISSSVG